MSVAVYGTVSTTVPVFPYRLIDLDRIMLMYVYIEWRCVFLCYIAYVYLI